MNDHVTFNGIELVVKPSLESEETEVLYINAIVASRLIEAWPNDYRIEQINGNILITLL